MDDFVIENGMLKKYTGTAMDIIIPESVIAIDMRAFGPCREKLQSITLSAGITIIPEYAFSYCENLQSVTLPESLTVIGRYAFWNCRNLQSITIPEGVISIDAHAFDSCDNLQHVTIPESVTTIRQWAFGDCEKLTIHAPRGSFAEAYAKRKRIPFLAEKREKTIAKGQGILLGKAIVVTGDLEYFPEDGPYPQRIKFRNLVEKHDGKLTSSISGKTSYLVCNNRRSGTVKVRQAREKNIPIITEKEFLAMLGESRTLEGFEVKGATLSRYHGTATELVIPEWVTDIADWTFSNCENLQSITIPETVERMGDEVFYGCDNLRCITLLGKVQDGVAFGVPRNQTLELVAPNVPLAIWKRYGLMFVAGLGFLTHRKLYTNAAIVAEYEKYIEPRYKKAMEQLWKTDPVEAVQFYAEKGKITLINFDSVFLQPALESNATQCVAFLLDWKNRHLLAKADTYRI